MPFSHHALIARIGNEDGARQEFARLVAALAGLQAPGVRRIRENPGDWGIDAFAGRLDDEVSVWQAKFFFEAIGGTQQQQIRNSFKSAREAAGKNGYTLATWTLCIAIDMDGPEAKWWDGWRRRQERDYAVSIELWDRTRLDRLLASPDATAVDAEFFPPYSRSAPEDNLLVEVTCGNEAAEHECAAALSVLRLWPCGAAATAISRERSASRP